MHFQVTPLGGGYATAYGFVGGWVGFRAGRPDDGGLVGVFDTRLSIVVNGGALEIAKARCLVSLLDRRPLSWRILQFTSAAYTAR